MVLFDDEMPPVHETVLVDDGYRICLRYRINDEDWYDENEGYDDSGIEYEEWCSIPTQNPIECAKHQDSEDDVGC